MKWYVLPKDIDRLGLLPSFLSDDDPRRAREQFNENYGWHPLPNFTLSPDGLRYPGDPPLRLIAVCHFRDEVIGLYEYSWVVIISPDASYEVARMD